MLDERRRRTFDAVVWSVSMVFAAIFPIAAAADAPRYSNANAAYQAECGTCHIAYPPALLGPDGWRGIMNVLGRHFGTDASVDEAKRAELAAYLERSAGTRKVAGAERITEAGWFRKEHSRRVVWLRDLGCCAFVGAEGRPCKERAFVEFHHVRPFALGGAPTADNIQLRCRRHNDYEARVFFGRTADVRIPDTRSGNGRSGAARPP